MKPGTDRRWLNAAVFFFTLVIAFLIVEISIRRIFPPPPVPVNAPFFRNFNQYFHYPDDWFSAELGWVSPPGFQGYGPFGETISIDGNGYRHNGIGLSIKEKPVVLAMGDSFTYGAEVNDAETWPAQLEATAGIRVINAAQGGYGLGQMLTRTKLILQNSDRNIDILIVAFIAEDIRRVKKKKQYGVPKPYYAIENAALVLNTVRPDDFSGNSCFRNILGKSYAVHLLMSKIFRNYWLEGSLSKSEIWADIDEVEVSRRIIDEFLKMNDKVKFMIFTLLPASYHDFSLGGHPVTRYIRDISEKNKHVFLLDLQATTFLKESALQTPIPGKGTDVHSLFHDKGRGYHGHFSKDGNAFVARELFSFLKSIGAVH